MKKVFGLALAIGFIGGSSARAVTLQEMPEIAKTRIVTCLMEMEGRRQGILQANLAAVELPTGGYKAAVRVQTLSPEDSAEIRLGDPLFAGSEVRSVAGPLSGKEGYYLGSGDQRVIHFSSSRKFKAEFLEWVYRSFLISPEALEENLETAVDGNPSRPLSFLWVPYVGEVHTKRFDCVHYRVRMTATWNGRVWDPDTADFLYRVRIQQNVQH